jgi:hypothetical protein
MHSGYYFEPLLYPSSTYIRRGRILSSTQFCNTILKHSFHTQVEGEAIEDHISDKEPTYQRCISARSCKSLSVQSHLGKLFESRKFMVDICKRSYIINAIRGYCLLGFFLPVQGFPGVYVLYICMFTYLHNYFYSIMIWNC